MATEFDELDTVLIDLSGAVDALREIVMSRASVGKATDGEIYLMLRICGAVECLEGEVSRSCKCVAPTATRTARGRVLRSNAE